MGVHVVCIPRAEQENSQEAALRLKLRAQPGKAEAASVKRDAASANTSIIASDSTPKPGPTPSMTHSCRFKQSF